MQYGFLIDHTRCIGCHACTVACKAENAVPVGSFRTWVKYVERGKFPSVRRHFGVLRCNHCTKAPCVTICPVNALQKRPDGIVDLDRDACIGCRACMQACPYDAIYINEDTGSAEKCHFCAHRVERDLPPACAVVCPEEAIVWGDLHDPQSRIARMVGEGTLTRRPEQRTGPNVHYRGVEPLLLEPGKPVRPETYLWSERPPHKPEPWPAGLPVEQDARVVLDAGHRVEWGPGVAAYLVTKSVAGGVGMLAPFAAVLGLGGPGWLPETVGLAMTAVTTLLLVLDLTRPAAFLRILLRPNTKSWLVRGAWVLIAYSLVLTASLGARLVGMEAASDALRWVGLPLGAATAGYTAFLFAQCEGRDLWQSRGMLAHLLLGALLLGAAVLLPFGGTGLTAVFVAAAAGFALSAALEAWGRHETDNARQGAAFLRTLKLGLVPALPLALLSVGLGALLSPWAGLAGAVFALIGVTLYELALVRAGQLPPLS